MKVKTNNRPRPILWSHDLSAKELRALAKDMDVTIDSEKIAWWIGFRYKGEVYSLEDFGRIKTRSQQNEFLDHWAMTVDDNSPLANWEGYQHSSLDGIVIRFVVDDYGDDQVIVGVCYGD